MRKCSAFSDLKIEEENTFLLLLLLFQIQTLDGKRDDKGSQTEK